MNRIKQIIDKMSILGSDKLIISSQRTIENNFTEEQFNKSLVESFQIIADYAKGKNIQVVYRPSYRRAAADVQSAISTVKHVERPNFSLAPSIALLLLDKTNLDKNIEALKQTDVSDLIVSAPQFDLHHQIWNMNRPIYQYEDKEAVLKIINSFPNIHRIMDGLYDSWDDEYLDSRFLNSK